jgi:signal transduction histidine kinase
MEMSLRVKGDRMELVVSDNGRGLTGTGGGIGLVSIQEHAAALGGSASLSSNHHGTTIVVSIPANAE